MQRAMRPVVTIVSILVAGLAQAQQGNRPPSQFADLARLKPGVNNVPGTTVYVPPRARVPQPYYPYLMNRQGYSFGQYGAGSVPSATVIHNAFQGGTVNPWQPSIPYLPSVPAGFLGGAPIQGMPFPAHNPIFGAQAPIVGTNPSPPEANPPPADNNLVVPFPRPLNGVQEK